MRGKLDNGNDQNKPQLSDPWLALALLTRLPLPAPPFDAANRRPAAASAWAYPLVGFVTGLLMILVVLSALVLSLPAPLAALLALATGLFVTGAMHEDGLADCVDGFWGGWTRERRLEIMKDSHIGTYGVTALILSLGFRWQAMLVLIEAGMIWKLLTVEVLSRAAMVWVMYALPHARQGGLSRQTGRPARLTALLALGIGLGTALLSGQALLLIVLAVLATLGMQLLSRAKIGGQTGDVLGATQQVTALALLAGLCAGV